MNYIENLLVSTEKRSTRIEVFAGGDGGYDIGTSIALVKSKQAPSEFH